MSKLSVKQSLLCMFLATVALTLTGVANASAAQHSCAKHGYTLTSRTAEYVTLKKKVRGKDWEEGPFNHYVCSPTYGKFVFVGVDGVTPDGPEWADVDDANARFAAVVEGHGGNADGGFDGALSVYDLKTGKQVSSSAPTETKDGFEPYVMKVALGNNGAVAWAVAYYLGMGYATELRVLGANDRKSTVLATGNNDAVYLMRWNADSTHLNWTSEPKIFDFTPRKWTETKPLKGGHCTGRTGDVLVGRGYGNVYFTRSYKAAGWAHGRVLISCSLKYKRRIAIAHSGTSGGSTYSFETPTVNENFAAVVTRTTDATAKVSTQVEVYDLARNKRICSADPPPFGKVKISRVALDGTGVAAWVASGETGAGADANASNASLQICDDQSARVLWSSPQMDPGLLEINDFAKQLRIADPYKVFP